VVDASRADAVSEVLALTEGGVEHAFEVVGAAATIRQAWDMLAPGGTAVVVGVAPRGLEVALPALDFLSEKTITGSYYGSGDTGRAMARIVQLLTTGRLELDDVVSHVIRLHEVQDALERLRRGEGARSIVVIDEQLAGRTL
jgi:S-(hydroxymethyl)glutathione dehydrogenase/alcohol dehydrogenase